MAEPAAIRMRGGGPLGAWIGAPIVGLVVVIGVATQLKASTCGGTPTEDAGALALTIVTGLGVIATFAAGVWRAVRLIQRNGRLGRVARLVVALLLLAAAAVLVDFLADAPNVGAVLMLAALFVGFVVSVTSFLWLLSALPDRLEADDVGVELPAYLFGFSLFVYPVVFLIAVFIACGGLGE
jgi:hypothetical protein